MAEQKNNGNSFWVFDDQEFDLGTVAKISQEEITVFRDIAFKIRHPDGKREVPWPQDCQPKKEVFGNDLAYQYIYEWETNNKWSRAYEIEVNAFIGLQYTIDFEGTKNCDIQTAFKMNGNILNIELQPFEKENVVLITCNTKEDNQYNIKGSWKKCKIDPQLYRESITIANNKITQEYNKCLSAGLNEEVSWDKMPAIIRDNGLLFVDGEFYPGNEALFYKGNDDANAVSDKNNDNFIMWRRAGDFLNGPFPVIFKNPNNLQASIRPEYIRMGDADDAWLIAVLSVCALKPQLIANLFLSKDGGNDPSTNNEDKMYGFYRMKLCENGIWKECILDDLFPCQPYYLPIMANTPNNDQLWPHLCEKLVAKLKGNCYESLDGGAPAAAFADITGCPTEIYDLEEYDFNLVLKKINDSYNGGNHNLLAVAVCKERNEVQNIDPEEDGLLETHTYSVLGIQMGGGGRIKLRDPFGRIPNNFKGDQVDNGEYGVFWLGFDDFEKYFSNVIVCYSSNDYKEARQTIDISYDNVKKEVSVPILKLTVPNGGNVEYLGLSQKDIMTNSSNQKLNNNSQLDLCLFVFKSSQSGQQTLNVDTDEPYGYIPMSTQRNKFVKFGANADDVKSNDLSSGIAWKNGDRLTGGEYFLVPWSSGVQWDSEEKANYGSGNLDTRYIGFTVHGKCNSNGSFSIQPVDGYSGKEILPVLLKFGFKYGEKKQWQDLERRHFQMGQLDIYCGKNTCNDKNLLFSMTPSDFSNVVNAKGFQEFKVGSEVKYKVEVGQSQLFAVNVPKDPQKEYSSVYKYGLQNEWL